VTDTLAGAQAQSLTRDLSEKARGTGSACLAILGSVTVQASCLASRKGVASPVKLARKNSWCGSFLFFAQSGFARKVWG
jgi:hypothetical protein